MTKSDIKEQENQIKNNVMAVKGRPKFSVAIQSDTYKNLVNNTLGDKNRATRFIANITTVVSNNPQLQECDSGSILSAGLLAESLNLSLSPQLGFCYLVPFNDSKRGCKVAQYQMGWKGFLQLAMRSGQYKDIDVIEIKEGEYLGRDEETGKQKFKFISNDEEREKKETIGYLAYFEYLNGFRKQVYWSRSQVEKHALQYSQGYRADKSKGTSYTFWTKNFRRYG